VALHIHLRPLLIARIGVLEVGWEGDVGNAAVGQCGTDGEVGEIDDMGRAHDALVEAGHVLEQVIRVDVLLVHRPDQVVVRHARDRQHRGLVHLGVV
jgi:hypothetical protein